MTEAITLSLFSVYLVAMIAIGLFYAWRSRGTEEDYFLGGRRISAFAVALSAVSSGRSAWLVLGASAIAWSRGVSAVWIFPGYVIAEFLLLFTMGRRLRERSGKLGAITIPEVLGRGTGSSHLPVRKVAALVVVLFLVTYVSAQLVAGGKALESLFQVDGRTWGLCITASIVLIYTFLGGYHAVVVTDVLQALFMILGLLALPLFALVEVGGFAALFDGLRELDPELVAWNRGWPALVGGIAIGLGSLGNPPILVRAMSIAEPRDLSKAASVGLTWNVLMAGGALLIGLVGRVLYPDASVFANGDAEHLYVHLGARVSEQYLFAGFVGVLLAALFAAIMSTCDSQLLVIASSLSRDFRGERTVERGVAASRLAVAVALFAAVAISFGAEKYVGPFVLFSWGALGAAFGPPLLFLLYDGRTTARGVLAGMIVGSSVVVLWGTVPALDALIYELVPGFLASALVVFLLRARPADG